MKDLFITNEMKKFQDAARHQWANKTLDLDAVMCGWKLDAGYVLYSDKATVTLLEKPRPHITKIVKVDMSGKQVETSIDTIARLILGNQVIVYYSK